MNVSSTADSRLVLAAARTHLMCFAALHYPTFDLNWHLFDIAANLERVDAGAIPRLTMAAPLRHGKSWLCSQVFVAWFLSRHPELSAMVITYSEDLAIEFGREVRNLLMSPVNRLVFPECQLARDSAAADRFHTTAGGGLAAIGLGGAIFGRGADLIVIDDSLRDPRDVKREKLRRDMREFFAQVVYTRLSPTGRIVVAAARSHPQDLIGWLLRHRAADGWVSLSYAAIAQEDEPRRKKGEPLWGSRYSLERVRGIEAMLGDPVAFNALMLQLTAEGDGPIFRNGRWHWTEGQVRLGSRIQSWDLAHKTGELNDYSACLTLAWQGDHWLIVDVFRGKFEFLELLQTVHDRKKHFRARTILVEQGGPGIPLVQTLKYVPIGAEIKEIHPVGSKEARAHAAMASIESGFLRLHRETPGSNELLAELEEFPDGEHDDLVDCLTQAAAYALTNPGVRPEDLLDLTSESDIDRERAFYADPLDWTPPQRRR